MQLKKNLRKQIVKENATINLVDVSVNEIFNKLSIEFKITVKICNFKIWQKSMNIEEEVKKCEIYSKQIKQYDPDPFYVDYFFNKYINSINNIINGIFQEANIDFGLFITGKITLDKFKEKANTKKRYKCFKIFRMVFNKI